MKIGIIDADLLDHGTQHPNLALMKISAFNKEEGHDVELLETYDSISKCDHVYISKVFSFSNYPENLLNNKNISIGGTGFFANGGTNLSSEIEHHFPDYHLYDSYIQKRKEKGYAEYRYSDYLDYSIGFTTRGCIRRCNFCVNKKYDKVYEHSPVKEFLDPSRPKIYLWDDNILAYDKWRDVFDELIATDKYFQFRQGLDIRLLTEEKADVLSKVKYNGDYIFAFDYIEDREIIESKLRLWKTFCKKTTKLYILVGFSSQDEIDVKNTLERIAILMKYGCIPYIMRHEKYNLSPYKSLYVHLARWCNQPQFFKKMSFRQFCIANQDRHKTSGTYCSTYKAMIEFQNAFPDIAKEYFDLRFEEVREF